MLASPVVAAVLLAALPQVQDAPGEGHARVGEIRGVVHGWFAARSTPLPAALVEVSVAGRRLAVAADSTGAYVLGPVPAGKGRMRVVHAGHEPLELEVLVPAGGTLALDIVLLGQPVDLGGVTVVADREEAERAGEAPDPSSGLAEVDLKAMSSGPGLAEAGIAGIARAAAGDDPGDPGDVLFMRGSTADLKLVLLDGAPVYAPFHMGGLLPTFDGSLMGGARHYVGGAPARYDGGLSYILDLSTRAPRRDRFSSGGALDLFSARASVEGPLGQRAGYLVGGRALHSAGSQLLSGGPSPYGYGDALVRFEVDLAEGHRLSATGFFNREAVFLDLAGAGLAAVDGAAEPERDATWGNQAASLTYRGRLAGTFTTVRVAGGRYDARMPISRRAGDVFARGATARGRLTADLVTPTGWGELRYGVSADRVAVTYDARSVGVGGNVLVEDAASGDVLGGYAEAALPLGRRVRLWAGMRMDRFSTDASIRPAPRLKLAWMVSDNAVLSLAAGRYHQLARASDESIDDALVGVVGGGPEDPVGGAPLLPVATATHLVASLDQMLVPTVRLGLDGYVKVFDGVSAPGQRLNASGADLRVQHAGGDITMWLGYSLAWLWADDGLGYTSERFTGQQLLSAGASGLAWDRVGLDLRLGYGDGLPLTAVQVVDAASVGSEAPGFESGSGDDGAVIDGGSVRDDAALWPGGGRADQFLRLDAEVSGIFETRIGSRPMLIRPYLRVVNALGRRDALFFYFDSWRSDDVQPLVESAVLPILGFEWRF
jgi:hypothetical protein